MNRLLFVSFLISILKYGSAGICWSQMRDVDGQERCQGLLSASVTREECCNNGPRAYLNSYTTNEVDSGTLFRWIALEGGAPYCQLCRDSCDGVNCGVGKFCKINKKGRPRCVCDLECSSDQKEREVCGTDEVTYSSECHLHKARCRKEQSIEVGYYGGCKASCEGVVCPSRRKCIEDSDGDPHCIACGISCPKPKSSDELVCGTDGMTYESICQLDTERCLSNPDLALAYKGKCDATRPLRCENLRCAATRSCRINQGDDARCVFCSCSDEWTMVGQVCGTNNVTYSNMCQLRDEVCRTGKVIEMKQYGPCPVPRSTPKEESENTYIGFVEYGEYSGGGQDDVKSTNSTTSGMPTLNPPKTGESSYRYSDEFDNHSLGVDGNNIRHSRNHKVLPNDGRNGKLEEVTKTHGRDRTAEKSEKLPSETIVWEK